jgi:hypothetical protein
MEPRRLTASIAQIVRDKGPLCAGCITELTAAKHGADNVDVSVAVILLALDEQFRPGSKCRSCDARDETRSWMRGSEPTAETNCPACPSPHGT